MILGGRFMSLATRLNQLRLRKGQSLQDVADAIGVSKTHIWELEKGRSDNPSLEMLTKLANHFGVTIRSLVGEDPESSEDEKLAMMFRQAGELGPNDRAVLEDMIRSMVARNQKRGAEN
jgi:transcriptional regulator with XRE-family HTH domain